MISFKEFLEMRHQLDESPYLDTNLGIDRLGTESSDRATLRNHENAIHLGDSYYKQIDDDGDGQFYHLNADGNIDTISRISDGVQELIRKNQGVSSDIPLRTFGHALDHYGRIMSDDIQTPGSKKFWQSLPNHFPNAKFKLKNTDLDREISISKDDLKQKENGIWGNNKDYIRLIIEK